jgi:hypothetical protein
MDSELLNTVEPVLTCSTAKNDYYLGFVERSPFIMMYDKVENFTYMNLDTVARMFQYKTFKEFSSTDEGLDFINFMKEYHSQRLFFEDVVEFKTFRVDKFEKIFGQEPPQVFFIMVYAEMKKYNNQRIAMINTKGIETQFRTRKMFTELTEILKTAKREGSL